MKKLLAVVCVAALLMVSFGACVGETNTAEEESEENLSSLIVVGFSQVGAESEWRVANTESMKAALSEENGYELIYDDARNEQENQIRAIRTFIQQDVDYIVFSPRVETGWTSILQEAQDAGIPVIVISSILDDARRRELRERGVDHLVEKPVSPPLLAAAVEEIRERQEAEER